MGNIRILTLFGLLTSFIISCKDKDSLETSFENQVTPTVSTSDISSLNSYSAVLGGNVISSGGADVTSRGICFAAGIYPTIYDSIVSAGAGTGPFTVTITGLIRGKKYWARAYAKNMAGVVYGNQITFYPQFIIGQNYQGGILFYLDNSGNHGLISSLSDQSTGTVWGCNGDSINGAAGKVYGSGPQNTADIINGCTASDAAASVCKNLISEGYNDWFLPSNAELQLLYEKRSVVGGFNGSYWSSSQYNANNAYYQNFSSGFQGPQSKNISARVRAIRAF